MISRYFSTAAFVGGNPRLGWHKQYLTDIYGIKQTREYTAEEYIDLQRKLGKSEAAIAKMNIDLEQNYSAFILNPNYDPKIRYVPRSERPTEWTCCEKSGIVIVETIGDIAVGDFVISADSGLAKRADRVSNIKVLEIVDVNYAKVDISNQYLAECITINAYTAGDTTLTFSEPFALQDLTVNSFVVGLKSRRKLKLKLKFTTTQVAYDTMYAELYSAKNTYEFELLAKKRKSGLVVLAELLDTVESGQYSIRLSPSSSIAKIATTIKLY
jgi:hypothetical protein